MIHMDKQKIGAFIAVLRKEKGLTQKELAEQLFISDKAVSKWETAASVPGIDLLIPLADILGVTVTELLMGRRMEQDNILNDTQVDQVVKTALSYAEEEQTRTWQVKTKWGFLYFLSFLLACLEILFLYRNGQITIGLMLSVIFGGTFGVYFCFFAKTKLPAYYDENRMSGFTDGMFQMNLPGLSLNNSNWGKILEAWRIWAVTLMVGYPVINYIQTLFFTGVWLMILDFLLSMFFILGGLFIPAYVVGKKYE